MTTRRLDTWGAIGLTACLLSAMVVLGGIYGAYNYLGAREFMRALVFMVFGAWALWFVVNWRRGDL